MLRPISSLNRKKSSRGVSFELIGKGKELADAMDTEVTAVLLGSKVEGLCDELAEYGADKVILVDNEALEPYRTEPYAHAMATIIEKYKPAVVLYGATAIGRDLAPRVSARVRTAVPPGAVRGQKVKTVVCQQIPVHLHG